MIINSIFINNQSDLQVISVSYEISTESRTASHCTVFVVSYTTEK